MDKNGKERIGLCLVVLPISKKIGEGLVKMLPDAFESCICFSDPVMPSQRQMHQDLPNTDLFRIDLVS